jgi:hypothetical protein
MQFGLPFARVPVTGEAVVTVAGRPVRAQFVRHRRARHYILRITADGVLRVTMPWRGSRVDAERFVRERCAWIERERYARALVAGRRGSWTDGAAITLRGAEVRLTVIPVDASTRRVTFGDCSFTVRSDVASDLRPHVERRLRRIAEQELPDRLRALAAEQGMQVAGVTIRAQRSRWGSCSPSRRISLNWRLIQMPPHVADYVLLHELAHLRHPNHSAHFWREVERLCPWHRDARAWLRANAQTHALDM